MKLKLIGSGRNQKAGECEMHYGLECKVMADGSRIATVSDDDSKKALKSGHFSKVK